MVERRVLHQLAVLVAIALRDRDQPRRLEDEIALLALRAEAVGRAARHDDVVAGCVGQVAEDRLDRPAAFVHEDDLVPFAVAEEVVHLVGRPRDRDLDVVVPHQELPAGHGVAAGCDVPGLQVPVRVGFGHPFLAHDRHELAALDHPARRLEVVEDRLEAREALEPHHLLRQERPVVAVHDVSLPRQVTQALVERHVWRISARVSSGR